MKTRIAIIFGGRSGEHEISIRSARTVIEQIDKEKYEVIPIAVSRAGEWLNPAQSLSILPEETRKLLIDQIGNYPQADIALLADTRFKGLTRLDGRRDEDGLSGLDVVFPVLHGPFGEDGTIQGLLEMAGIPYVGCGVLASACGMDKVFMKSLFRDAELPMCSYVWFLRSEWEQGHSAVIQQVKSKLGFPCFVKPANLGSSVGISRAEDEEQLQKAIELAAAFDRKIIVEEALDVREIECAVMGYEHPKASLPGEYIVKDAGKKFLDYTEKYAGTGNNEFIVPSFVSEELTKKIRDMAVSAFRAIDGSGLARVDFFLRNDNGALLVNEINTMPGLTDASGFPKMWAGTGMNFSDVIDALVEYAMQRHADKERNKISM